MDAIEPAMLHAQPLRILPLLNHRLSAWLLAVALALAAATASAAPLGRQQALRALDAPQAADRAAGVARLAEIGTLADARRVADRLRDADPQVRALAGPALWLIWSRSGDPATDRLLAQGIEQMGAGELDAALATFTRVVERRPSFAEGWNKRATVRFMRGEDEASLKDCEETLKRNPMHFGALSGMAHIHLRRGDVDLALDAWVRALAINPNLEDGPEMLELLEEAVRLQGTRRT
jgi:tetratricopeptide (TPR) repeat protein